MSLNVTQEQKQLQTQTLNQSLIEALNLLTMPSADLEAHLEEECEKNPLLKITRKSNVRDINASYVSPSSIEKSNNYQAMLNQVPSLDETLPDTLKSQLNTLILDKDEKTIGKIIISALDENGLLHASKEELLKNINAKDKYAIFEKMRELIKSFDPQGSASYTVWEAMKCALDALKSQGKITEKDYELTEPLISEEGFSLIAKGKENAIARHLNVDTVRAKEILSIIKSLSPYPGSGYSAAPSTYVLPEISIKKNKDGSLTVSLMNDFIPSITIDDEYIKLLNTTDDPNTKKYLDANKKKAENLISALEERDNTLLLIGKALASKQYGFFTKGPFYIAPLTLKEVANEINRDESTISRITSSKYIETDFGIFPLKTFFSRSGGTTSDGSAISRDKIKLILKEIIEAYEKEDKRLSDEKLRAELERKDINLSRRTVNKYRLELGL